MRVNLLVVGKLKEPSWRERAEEYAKRLRPYVTLDITELRDADATREGERILKALEKGHGQVFALAEEGKCRPSAALAQTLGELRDGGQDATFIIGGAYGLSDAVKARADALLSLSPMTFTHEMARVVLLEQIYRAFTILAGTGYHH
ncbi:23S rRNA (pseudouridine(1915)-N(3))-methyltransferase RlmH [Ruficoccus amylovorans]|uniref:Ribosomal RNA large subunit methyltransferase H n=1 Tax=Ruficoccus amylovorans TaxID=1804625 RepID=A0A842HIP4_9BACT|nr:23S rRNA (pseudouridine(1915)-N(3))-methyltransferase RlmH [Ruficoccus amylovorans]MBC2596229.1 23S rRNA (pseudouridine(1915)-N(3))-methyltransferase RlmH [Ruficoccus amylovorans]